MPFKGWNHFAISSCTLETQYLRRGCLALRIRIWWWWWCACGQVRLLFRLLLLLSTWEFKEHVLIVEMCLCFGGFFVCLHHQCLRSMSWLCARVSEAASNLRRSCRNTAKLRTSSKGSTSVEMKAKPPTWVIAVGACSGSFGSDLR